jgi:hypothetical protein
MGFRARHDPVALGRPAAAPMLPAGFGQSPGLTGIMQGLGDVLNIFAERKQKEDALWSEQMYSQFVVAWTEDENERRQQALADPKNQADYSARSLQAFQRAKESFLDTVDNSRRLSPDVRRALETKLAALEQQQGIQTMNIDVQRNRLATTDMLQQMQDVLVNEVISTPGLWEDREQKLLTAIAENQDALGENAISFARAAKIAIRNAHVQGRIKEDPINTLSDLHAGEFDRLLTPDDKQRMISNAHREMAERDRQEERLRKAEAAAVQEQQDQNYADINVRIAEKNIEEHELVWMLRNGRIRSSQFLTARANLKRENADVGDHDEYMNLRIAVQAGEAGIDRILQSRHLISDAQEKELVALADTVERRGGIFARHDVKQEERRIRDMIGGVLGIGARLDDARSIRVTNAVQEYQDRVSERPEDARQIADDVINRYRPPDHSPAVLLEALPRARFWQGNFSGTREDLEGRFRDAYRRTQAAREAGTITPAEYNRQLQDLRNYQRIIGDMNAN